MEGGISADIVVSDLVMPKLDGENLVTELLKVFPDLPVIFTSGYVDTMMGYQEFIDKGFPFLHKPYHLHQLTNKIREVLGGDHLQTLELDKVEEPSSIEEPQKQASFQRVSKTLRDDLYEAVEGGEMDRILLILEQIEKEDQGLVHHLQELMDDFDYEGIQLLLGES